MIENEDPNRCWYNIGEIKVPYHERAVRAVLPDPDDDDKGFVDAIGADEESYPLGEQVVYALHLREDEVASLHEAAADDKSHVQFVEQVTYAEPCYAGNVGRLSIPTPETAAWMRHNNVDLGIWNGQDVLVAVLDQGTTQAVRDYMGFNLVSRVNYGDVLPAGQELQTNTADPSGFWSHGCLVAPNAVPKGGQLLDCLVINSSGSSPDTYFAAAVKGACDAGARLLNYSFGTTGAALTSTQQSALTYAANVGAVITIANGNDNTAGFAAPAIGSKTNTNVVSVIAYDENLDARSGFSNYDPACTCCAPGTNISSLTPTAAPTLWNGTSGAAPHTCLSMAYGCTGGVYTAMQSLAALKTTLRDTGQGSAQQGGGAVDLGRLIANLTGATTTAPAGASTPTVVASRVDAGFATSFAPAVLTNTQNDDLRLWALITPNYSGNIVAPPGWALIRDQNSSGMRLRVYAQHYRSTNTNSQTFTLPDLVLGYGWLYTSAQVVLRASSVIDFRRIPLFAKFFATGTAYSTPSIQPRQSNDLVLDVFWNLDNSAANARVLTPPATDTALGSARTTSTNGFSGSVGSRTLAAGTPITSVSAGVDSPGNGGGALSIIVPAQPAPSATVLTTRKNLSPYTRPETAATGATVKTVRSGLTGSPAAGSAAGRYNSGTTLPAPIVALGGTWFWYVNVTNSSGGTSTSSDLDVTLPTFNCTPGLNYQLSLWVAYWSSVQAQSLISVNWYNSSGTLLSTAASAKQNIGVGTTAWGRVVYGLVAPANAATGVATLSSYGLTATSNTALAFLGILYEQTTSLRDFIDGASPMATWDGTAYASTSTQQTDLVAKQFVWAPEFV